jgi:N6-L-threonylcarbamoyladenine synthase
MGLPYPGGPALAALAETATPGRAASAADDRPPRAGFQLLRTQDPGVAGLAGQRPKRSDHARDIARDFEEAIVDTLAIKCRRALSAAGLRTLIVAGGVGANKRLRSAAWPRPARRMVSSVAFPRPEFCTDNGAMIAFAGALRLACRVQHQDPARRAPALAARRILLKV